MDENLNVGPDVSITLIKELDSCGDSSKVQNRKNKIKPHRADNEKHV